MNRRMMMNLTCGGRGCYRFGVLKNVKSCPRHPTLSTIASAQLPLLHLANGDTKLHNLAMVSCVQTLAKVYKCAVVHAERVGRWLCKGGTLCMWRHAACNANGSLPHFCQCFKLSTAVNVDFERQKNSRVYVAWNFLKTC